MSNRNVHDSEVLREALVELHRTAEREKAVTNELTTLLTGLEALTDYSGKGTLFSRLLSILKPILKYEEAFILTSPDPESDVLKAIFATSAKFEGISFRCHDLFKRVIGGTPALCFNIEGVQEWDDHPAELLALVRSAIHLPIKTESRPSILVCTHSQVGFFQNRDLTLLRKFGLLISQAIRNLDYVLSLQTEVRERIRAEQQVEEQQIQIVHASKMAALGEMAGDLAHEINTPLAAIQLGTDALKTLLDEGAANRPDVLGVADSISEAVLQVARIVSGLRSFSRDGRNDRLQRIDAQQLIGNALALCRETLKLKGIDLRLRLPEQPLMLACRAVQIEQVLLNLINNARDAVGELQDKWIEISARHDGTWIEIAITDSGPGVFEEIRDQLFQPFFTTKEFGKGVGLGLSIARDLIGQHGGLLFLDEKQPTTCFKIRLPAGE